MNEDMLNRIGKQAKIKLQANKKLKEIYREKGITQCEARLSGCMQYFGLSWYHRHKRVFYYDKPDLLSSFNQTILVCANCHPKLEQDRKLTETKFEQLRGMEIYRHEGKSNKKKNNKSTRK